MARRPPQGQNRKAFTMVEVLVSIVIAGIGLSGTISAYVISARRAEYLLCASAAHTLANQRLEQARAAEWNVWQDPAVDQLVDGNFPTIMLPLAIPQMAANNVTGRVVTAITTVSATPPVRRITVNCIWSLWSKSFTNTAFTLRSPET